MFIDMKVGDWILGNGYPMDIHPSLNDDIC